MVLEVEDDIAVVGEAANGEQAVHGAQRLKPDVVLMDIRMPELDGIAATRQIVARRAGRAARVLILTTFDLDEYVYDALGAGASGFLLKDSSPDAARRPRSASSPAARRCSRPSITSRLIEQFARTRPRRREPPPGLDELTARELEVFKLIARGMSNAEIAASLVVSDSTVKTHVARLLAKLGLRDRVHAVVLAYESGLVTPGLLIARPAVVSSRAGSACGGRPAGSAGATPCGAGVGTCVAGWGPCGGGGGTVTRWTPF